MKKPEHQSNGILNRNRGAEKLYNCIYNHTPNPSDEGNEVPTLTLPGGIGINVVLDVFVIDVVKGDMASI